MRALLLLGAWREAKSRRGETPEVPLRAGRKSHGKTMGLMVVEWNFHGQPWENGGLMMVEWNFNGQP